MNENLNQNATPPRQPNSDILPDRTMSSCQWFIGHNRFCDKIKKDVSCDGDINRCPFCK